MKRIFIVDDHQIVRRGLCQLFEREAEFSVCGDAADAAQALSSIQQLHPDLVVADLKLEGSGGLELTKQLITQYPDLRVLVVSMHDERLYAKRALLAGAHGYVMKCRPDQDIIRAAHKVLAGGTYVSEAIRPQVQRETLGRQDRAFPPSPMERLTDRELEVFLLISQGYAPRHIAEELRLSVSTVEVYRERLKEKLGIQSSALLLRYAVCWSKDHELI